MPRFFASAAAIALTSSAAFAADLPVYEAPPPVEPVAVGYNWSGFYIGPQGGWAWGELTVDDGLGVGFHEAIDVDGFFVGGVAGAQWQWNWAVLGVEAEGNWANIDGDRTGADINGTIDGDLNWFGSVGGKLGFALNRFMIYGTGGVSFAEAETGQSFVGLSSSDEQTFFGWMAGGGVDYAVTDNLIFGVQYRHYDFGDEDFDLDQGFNDRNGELDLDTISGHVTWKF